MLVRVCVCVCVGCVHVLGVCVLGVEERIPVNKLLCLIILCVLVCVWRKTKKERGWE